MSPAEDALLLLAIVRRHLRTLRFGLDGAYPEEDWGFTAQQAVEKLLKAWIVLADRRPPRVHDLEDLVALAGQQLDPLPAPRAAAGAAGTGRGGAGALCGDCGGAGRIGQLTWLRPSDLA